MKIPLKAFRDNQGQVFEEELDAEELDIDIGVMHFPEPIRVKAEALKSGDDLTVQVHIEGDRLFSCSLCLEEFDNLFEKDITLHYDIKGLDLVTIDQDVREEIMLDHPIRVLCRPDCRGLCAFCGSNLNEGTCDCKPEL
jgi:uncharacterized protein